jgi:hypothetical protein
MVDIEELIPSFEHFQFTLLFLANRVNLSPGLQTMQTHNSNEDVTPQPYTTRGRRGRGGQYHYSRQNNNYPQKCKPMWNNVNKIDTKINQLVPGAHGLNMVVKVVEMNMIVSNNATAEQQVVAEVLVGDETGTIVMAARNGECYDYGSCNV